MSWMIAELIGNINNLEYGHRRATYSNVLFPEPAIRSTSQQYNQRAEQLGKRTFAMDPQ